MPLRAKITNPALAQPVSRGMASKIALQEIPGDEPNDVQFDTVGGVRHIKLSRPKKLNSLNASMIRKILPRLREWSKSDLANVIVIKGEGRAFCAGGDVAHLALQNKKGAEGQQESKDYFALEYILDHLIATYKKPYVAFIDGITMGGGVGLSLHAPIRIATENTVFAMPETNIGFFPDVGASFFLPRMDGELGMYCALTSDQLKGVNVFYAGIATHYLHSSSLPDLENRLAELQFKDYDSLKERLQIINSTVEEFCTGMPFDQPLSGAVGGNIRAAIDYVFQPANDLNQILAALEGLEIMDRNTAGAAEVVPWAKKTRETILSRSPTSLHVTLKMLREGSKWSIAQAFRNEHALASRFMELPDFVEGVSALLVDKPKRKPVWSPNSIDAITAEEVSKFFAGKSDITLLSTEDGSTGTDFKAYPHSWIGLPTESDVQRAMRQHNLDTKAAVLKHFSKQTNGKQGVAEKINDILSRKTTTENGHIGWIR